MTSPDHGPRTPDSDPSKGPDYIEGLPEAIQIERIDAFRVAQETHIVNAVVGVTDYDERIIRRAEAIADFDDIAEAYLKSQGISDGDPKFGEYKEVLLRYTVDKVSPREWEEISIDPATGEVRPNKRALAVESLRAEFPSSTTPETEPDEEETEDEEDEDDPTVTLPTTEAIKEALDKDVAVKAAREKVKGLKEELARLTAQRQGKLFSFKSTKEAYAAKQLEYQTAVNALTRLELSVENSAGMLRSEEEERLDAVFKLMGNYQELQKMSIDEMKGTKVGKFVDFMTRGSMPVRILKGVGLGVAGAAALAVIAGTAGGALGAGIALGGGAAIRTARNFATFDNRAGRGMDALSDSREDLLKSANAETETTDESINLVHQDLMKRLEEENSKEQKKRRSSTYKSLGVVALSATAVDLIHVGFDAASEHYSAGKLHDITFGDDNAHAQGGGHEDQPGGGGDGNGSGAETQPPESQFESPKFDDARTIDPGEGFYQTFQEMGIPQKDWPALLDKAGPELHGINVDGHSLAYKMPNGEWGIRMTPDGKMPTEALDAINKAHEQLLGGGSGTDASSAAESTGSGSSSSGGIEFTDSADSSSSAEAVADTPPTVESLNEPIDHSSIDVITKETLSVSDVTNNTELMDLSHVATWYTPEAFAQKMGLSANEWSALETQIIAETNAENKLYTNTFEVQNGYLRFTGSRIPADTMADMLNRIPRSTRYDLAA